MTLARIRAGEPDALEELLRDAWSPLVRHLVTLTGSADAAQDAAQEAFVRLWERRERWEAGSARALLFRIGRNVALDESRRSRVRARPVPDASVAHAPAPDEEMRRGELHRRIEAALARLAPRRREVFELIRFAGLTHGEVAEAMEISLQTVANHMSLALHDLRADLADLIEPDADGRPEREGRRLDG